MIHSLGIAETHNAKDSKQKTSDSNASPLSRHPALLRVETEEGPEVAEFMRLLLEDGARAPGDSEIPLDDRPDWVDMEKLRLGQKFAQKYFGGLMLAEMLSLIVLFSPPNALQALIFTGNSDTPAKACRRYLSTVRRVRAWYTGDPWAQAGAAGKDVRTVRHMHAAVRSRMGASNPEALQRRTALQPPLLARGAVAAVHADFASYALPPELSLAHLYCATSPDHKWANQMEMSFTQWGFLGLAISYPERFGMGSATEEELEGFVHLWRVLGHLLGMDERFNFCAHGLESALARSRALLHHFYFPSLATTGEYWEHMSRCVVEGTALIGPEFPFEVALLYLCETLLGERKTPHVRRMLSTAQKRQYANMTWMLRWGLRFTPLRAFSNYYMHRVIDNAKPPGDEEGSKAVDALHRPSNSFCSSSTLVALAFSAAAAFAYAFLQSHEALAA